MVDSTVVRADDPTFRESLSRLVREHPAPLYLVRLSDTAVLEASDAALAIVGWNRGELVGRRVLDLVDDPENAQRSLQLLGAGVLDSFSRHSAVRRPDGTSEPIEVRYTTCFNPRDRFAAIGEIVLAPNGNPLGEPLGPAPEVTALGTVDGHWRLDRITSEVHELLGLEPQALLGQSAFTAVHPEDIATVLQLAAHAAGGLPGSAGRVRLRDSEGGWCWCRLTLHELVGGEPGSFALSISGTGEGGTTSEPRTKELEEHLRRIAREISSSGVAALSTAMPTSLEAPEISTLSSREYEILVRLARGERVAAIARTLFLSESTVRNHLTSVYRKFGVGSQQELLTRLAQARGREASQGAAR